MSRRFCIDVVAFADTDQQAPGKVTEACGREYPISQCSCVDASPKILGFAIFECPDRPSVDDLAVELRNGGFELSFIEKEQTVQTTISVSQRLFKEQALAACSEIEPFSFPQSNPPNWGLDRCDQETLPLDNSFNVQGELMGCGVYIYVLDTGVNVDHVEFDRRVLEGKDTTGSRNSPPYRDDAGHGTHCTGIAAGTLHGVAKGSFIIPVKVLDRDGRGTSTSVLNGFSWVIEDANSRDAPAVLSLSFATSRSESVNKAMTQLYEAGIVSIVASGNYNDDACKYSPASSPHVLTVSATEISDGRDARAGYSNFGSCVDVWAPGTRIESTWVGSPTELGFLSGTSMAAPHYAGMAALYLGQHPDATPEDVMTALKSGSTKVGSILGDSVSPRAKMCNVNALQCAPATDCQVSEWSSWSDCPAPGTACGTHSRVRTRSVIVSPQCGGAQCPNLVENSSCGSFEPCVGAGVPAQYFPSGDVDIAFGMLRLSPLADDVYSSCFSSNVRAAPKAALGGAPIALGDDESVEVEFGGGAFKFFGVDYGSMHVGSNGYITFGTGDFRFASTVGSQNPKPVGTNLLVTYEAEPVIAAFSGFSAQGFGRRLNQAVVQTQALESGATHWDLPRISAWFQDLFPQASQATVSTQVINESGNGHVVVNYANVPCGNEQGDTSTFQIVLWLEGSTKAGAIEMWWGELANCDGAVVGVAPGGADRPTQFQDVDFPVSVASCTVAPPPNPSPNPPPTPPTAGSGQGLSLFFS
ncbi:hypothetical protein BSKO_06305 [Bryopsis sp. KO-2023]|nr:hypothetical protein BSKO_06305 [Bryopsis sp. KO-2023]